MSKTCKQKYFPGGFNVFVLACLIMVCNALNVRALDPQKGSTQYIHDVWTTSEGLPQDSVSQIAQDGDGYIWFSTQEGLVRFDGVRFTVFDYRNTEAITSVVFTVFADRKGTLWLGASHALMRYRSGVFTYLGDKNGLRSNDTVTNISEDGEGNLWLGYSSGDNKSSKGGLVRFKDEQGTILTTKEGLSTDAIKRTFPDKEGNLWIATSNGLNLLKDGKFISYTTADGLSDNLVRTVYGDRAGNIWVGTLNGLNVFKDGKFTVYTTKEGLSANGILSIFEDKDGILWIGTERGLNRFKDGKFQAVTGIEGLADERIFAFCEDREESLWIGTANGLHRLRDAKFTPYGMPEGLLGNNVKSIYEDRAGRIWIGTFPGGLSVLGSDGQFTTYKVKQGPFSDTLRTVYEEGDGTFSIITQTGVNKLRGGNLTIDTANPELINKLMTAKFSSFAGMTKNNIVSFDNSNERTLWIGARFGLAPIVDADFKAFLKPAEFKSRNIQAIHEDRAGRLWIATDGAMGYFKDGIFTHYLEGVLKDANVQTILEEDDGTLWFGTWGDGLSRLKDGKLTTFTSKNGLFDDTMWSILEDSQGNLWMSSNRGIFRVSRAELNDFAEGRISNITSIVYGTSAGMRKSETNSGDPPALRASDGRFWFGTTAGVVVIDPNNIKTNKVPPPVVIEEVISDEQTVTQSGEPAIIAPGKQNIEFRYAGMSFIAPEKVKYKYKLEGFDEHWIDAGTRHTAYYTHLSPGKYEFRVIAANNDGVWNEQGAAFGFQVLPQFWQTWWFNSLMVLCAVGLAFFVYKMRTSQLKAENKRQESFSRRLIDLQENERKRIAGELHDSLSQNLVIIKNRAMISLQERDRTEQAFEQLEEIVDAASESLSEVREIAHNLRPFQIDRLGLTKAIEALVRKTNTPELTVTAKLDAFDGIFPPEMEINLYRIIQESLNNIIKHAAATEAGVTIERTGKMFEITIRDNGKGFDASSARLGESQNGSGFGLFGITERARILGCVPVIESAPGRGTKIYLSVESGTKQKHL